MGDQYSLRITLNSLGLVFQKQGRFDEAIQAFQRQIEISQTFNDQKSLVIGLNCLGRVFQKQRRLDEAIEAFQRQIKISQTLNDQKSGSSGLSMLNYQLSGLIKLNRQGL
ncbi:tetratricopeptide repeat protein [Coleofasciculus sp. G1-WW12-02]|uniref:tetratricopeptide repeat protein n=1 Tax=Coleofasciculus sp. G1-WW12-02 TaxID=3068483 RepID=UPI004063E8EF